MGTITKKIKNFLSLFIGLINKYVIISIIFFIIILPVIYYGIETKNLLAGSYLIALVSIYTVAITNLVNNDNIKLQLKQTENILSINIRKDEITTAIEQLEEDLQIRNFNQDHMSILLYHFILLANKDYLKNIPRYIKTPIFKFERNLFDDSNSLIDFGVDCDQVKYYLREKYRDKEEKSFCEEYKELKSKNESTELVNFEKKILERFERIINTCKNKDHKKIFNFLVIFRLQLIEKNIDEILAIEYLSNNENFFNGLNKEFLEKNGINIF